MSRVLVGAEGGEGGGRRQGQRAGLRTDASCWWRVCRRLRDTEGEEKEALFMIFHLSFDTNVTVGVSGDPHLTV